MIYGTSVRIDPRIHFAVSRVFATRLRVLVVTDGNTSFRDLANAPLGRALGVDGEWSYLQFDVTTAHRTSGEADLGHFRFDRIDLSNYDQIWVWRADHVHGAPLSPAEVQALSRFLDGGGRIYAARN
ncbi:MAG: hypothetical protein GX539_07820 [Candidatus Cloacimonetes bacterium]|jgi:hypothetical protein|nr:hypothetical protein [Candidatus Cloacimonadota bacterium]